MNAIAGVDPDTIEPVTFETRNFFHDGQNIGFIGDFVETTNGTGLRGRIYDAHFMCPEGAAWPMGQQFLGSDPQRFRNCRWVSVLVHDGGSVVVPEQFVRVIEPFALNNDHAGLLFPPQKED